MVKKIIHLADIHIPDNTERPYKEMLQSFFKQLYKNEIQGFDKNEIRIVVVGDIFHNKIRATNEARDLFHMFINFCSNLAKTYIVAGNHDMLQKNKERLDSISPSFSLLEDNDDIIYLDKELEYQSGIFEDENIIWNLFSMHNDFAPTNILHKDYPEHKIIGLYNGDVDGAVTDIGRMCDTGIDTSFFNECDCVMAGHIHKFQEIKKNGVPIVYAGSLFQQDAGENITGHGYVVWNMEDMTHKLVEVENNYRIFKFKIKDFNAFNEDKEDILNY